MVNVIKTQNYQDRLKQIKQEEYEEFKKYFIKEYYDNGIVIIDDSNFGDKLRSELKVYFTMRFYKDRYIAYIDDYGTEKVKDRFKLIFKVHGTITVALIVSLLLSWAMLSIPIIFLFGFIVFEIILTMCLKKLREKAIIKINKIGALREGKFSTDVADELIRKGEKVYYDETDKVYIISKY